VQAHPRPLLERYFRRTEDARFQVTPALTTLIKFARLIWRIRPTHERAVRRDSSAAT